MKYGKALTWDELADLYHGKARILPMETVFNWAEKQIDKFFYNKEEGTLHLLSTTEEE